MKHLLKLVGSSHTNARLLIPITVPARECDSQEIISSTD